MQAVKFLAPSRLRAGRWAGGVPQAARTRATAAPSVIAEQAFFMETSVVLACDRGHIRVSRIGDNPSFSHHLFHRIDLVIVVVSMRVPAPEGCLLPAPVPQRTD
ncbi:hypothetical protein AoKodu_08150 [Actinomyces oris K20]|nr:hypothetical protein AoKodu_08150 [Actinomyces oris K20]